MDHPDQNLKEKWEIKRAADEALRSSGYILVTSHQSRWHVVTPFLPEFRDAVKAIGGKWRRRSRVWSVPKTQTAELIAAITRTFGEDRLPPSLKGASHE